MTAGPATGEIVFRPATQDDLAMLSVWLRRPHWQEWWGDPDEQFGFIRDMVDGRDPHQDPFLVLLEEEPVGYIQRWRIGPHQTPEWAGDNPWLMELPADAVGVDLALAEAGMLSKGLGSRVLRRFADGLLAEGHRTIIIDPDPVNLRAVRAYSKAGFRPVPHLAERTDGVLIMQFHPDTDAP